MTPEEIERLPSPEAISAAHASGAVLRYDLAMHARALSPELVRDWLAADVPVAEALARNPHLSDVGREALVAWSLEHLQHYRRVKHTEGREASRALAILGQRGALPNRDGVLAALANLARRRSYVAQIARATLEDIPPVPVA